MKKQDDLEIGATSKMNMLGVSLIRIPSRSSDSKDFDIIYHKGVGYPLLQNVMELCKTEIEEQKKGNSIIPLKDSTIIIHYFRSKTDESYSIIFMDKKEQTLNYTKLYIFSRKIEKLFNEEASEIEIKAQFEDLVEIPKVKDLKAFFVIGTSGSPLFSRISQEESTMSQREVHIGGFISALFSFSREVIGVESGAKLKEINFGNQRFYMITRDKYIFVYLLEEVNEELRRYMYLIVDEFFEEFKTILDNFNGDITPYKSFARIFDQYFEMENN